MLKKIPVEQLRLGMHLQAFCGAWLEHPFWRTKFVLTDPRDLALVRESAIREVWIDIAKGKDVDTPESAHSPDAAPSADDFPQPEIEQEPDPAATAPASFSDEVKRASRIVSKDRKSVV